MPKDPSETDEKGLFTIDQAISFGTQAGKRLGLSGAYPKAVGLGAAAAGVVLEELAVDQLMDTDG